MRNNFYRTIAAMALMVGLCVPTFAQNVVVGPNQVTIDGKKYNLTVTITPVDVIPPATINAPTSLVVQSITKDTVGLSWKDNSDNETAFTVWRKDDLTDWAKVGTTATNISVFTDKGLKSGTKYTYKTKANNATLVSDYSPEVAAITLVVVIPPVDASTDPVISSLVDADNKDLIISRVGDTINIVGKNLGNGGKVIYNTDLMEVVSWSPTKIQVKFSDAHRNTIGAGLTVWRSDSKYFSTLCFPVVGLTN